MSAVRLSAIRKTQPIELEIGLDDSGTPVVKQYSIKELTGADRDAWLSEQSTKYDKGKDGKPSEIVNYEGMYSTLLKYCFYNDKNALVPEKEIQDLPSATQEALHGIATELNGLNKDKDAEKK